MAWISQQCENIGSEKSTQFTQKLDAVPTLHVEATFGQWYPEELSCSSFQNDCSLQLHTERPDIQKLSLCRQHNLSRTPAGKSEVNHRKKELKDVIQSKHVRSRSHIKADQRLEKVDASQTMLSSSKHGRVMRHSAVSFDKSFDNQSTRVNRRKRSEGGGRCSYDCSHRTEICSTDIVKSSVDEQGYNSHSKRSDYVKSVEQGNTAVQNCSTPGSELQFEMCLADNSATLFQSAAAINVCTAVDRTIEHGGNEWMNFTVKIEPLLVWKDVLAAGATNCRDNLQESDAHASTDLCAGMGDSEALVENIVHGGDEGLKSDFVDYVTFNSLLRSKSNAGNTQLMGNKCENLVNKYSSSSVNNDHIDRTFSSVLSTSSNHLQTDIGNNCLLYTSPSPRDRQKSRMPSSA